MSGIITLHTTQQKLSS